LTIAGVEVAEIISSGNDWDGIRVARVEKVEPHPNAGRLCLATVDVGGGEQHTVVCGAPNIAPGQKVAFATVGARLIDGHTGRPATLKAAKIRGVESAGMVLSEKELGLSDSHEGILVLPENAPIGRPLSSIIGETALDLDLTPNRPDLFSVLGVAREIAALTEEKWRDPSIQYTATGKPIKGRAAVEIEDPDLCPRYVAALVEDLRIGPSPAWMQERVIAAGLRPVNNVVDITNYVMLEMGQPLHAFDFARLRGGRIVVRRPKPGEKLRLLDGMLIELRDDMLVIADAEAAVALAGVMGGIDSEVTNDTTTVLLESANFNGPNIRRTSRALKSRTDASTRFEKGLSRRLPPIAAQRAVKLMIELCGGRAADGLIDAYPRKDRDVRINVTKERIRRVLGVDLPAAKVRSVLHGLGFTCRVVAPNEYVVRVPDWRTDVNIADDVIEELARIIGYDNLPTTLLSGELPHHRPTPLRDLRERARSILAAAGMQEIITYSMTDMQTLLRVAGAEELAANPPLRLANPLSRDNEYARTTLRGDLLATLARNIRGGQRLIALFEASRVYIPRPGDLPHEIETVAGVISGRKPDRWGHPAAEPAAFYDAKGYVEHLLSQVRVAAAFKETAAFAYLPGRTAAVFVGGGQIGLLGQVHPRVAASFDIKADVCMFELNLEALLPHVPQAPVYEPVPPYPSVEEDIALIVPQDVPAARVLDIIKAFPLVRAASIFDVYTGPPIPQGRKSLAISISFQAKDHTLNEKDPEETARQRERIIVRLRQELGAELRA
jgi:phenylalanyl-tRNA synthetase beta chain